MLHCQHQYEIVPPFDPTGTIAREYAFSCPRNLNADAVHPSCNTMVIASGYDYSEKVFEMVANTPKSEVSQYIIEE
jgi:hypothetical protein